MDGFLGGSITSGVSTLRLLQLLGHGRGCVFWFTSLSLILAPATYSGSRESSRTCRRSRSRGYTLLPPPGYMRPRREGIPAGELGDGPLGPMVLLTIAHMREYRLPSSQIPNSRGGQMDPPTQKLTTSGTRPGADPRGWRSREDCV